MKNGMVALLTLALLVSVSESRAQDGSAKKKVAATEAKAQVAADKADLSLNKEARKADKMSGNTAALKADRKARMKQEGQLIKDEAKKDVKVAKEKL